MLSLPPTHTYYYYYWSAWRTRFLMNHKEHHILRIWMDAPYATQKVNWELDQVSCCEGMLGWEAPSGPASHIPPVLGIDRGQRHGQGALVFLELPKKIDPLWTAATEPLAGLWMGEWRCMKLLWGLCSGPLTSTTCLGLQGCPGPEALAKNSDAVQKL